jgi:uncharacterized protein (TIGR04255 family)
MMPSLGPLPEFEKPPVSEVALSVEFLPLDKWRGPHSGIFWNEIASDYPETEVQPRLQSQIERFGAERWQLQQLPFEMPDADAARFWFVGDPPTRLLQIQKDRFIVNWRKITGDEIYPRYIAEVRPRFEREWARFKKFVSGRGLGAITPTQCEVTYVNDIPRGEGWDTFAEAIKLLSPWSGTSREGFLPPPETLSISGAFVMTKEMGRLHFATQHLLRTVDDKEVLQLRLTARGKPNSGDDTDILAWMDLGREWIVRGFTDLTTPAARALWKRRK